MTTKEKIEEKIWYYKEVLKIKEDKKKDVEDYVWQILYDEDMKEIYKTIKSFKI
jgi:hypothetical protein